MSINLLELNLCRSQKAGSVRPALYSHRHSPKISIWFELSPMNSLKEQVGLFLPFVKTTISINVHSILDSFRRKAEFVRSATTPNSL